LGLYDVVVVGGGPVGSRVAYKLAGLGYGVVVVEQKGELDEPVCCTGIIGQECVNSFALDESIILKRINGARVFSPSGKLLNLWRSEAQASVVDRPALNESLACLAQNVGVEYWLNSLVRGIKVENDRVKIEVANQEKEPAFFDARVVVIATGFASKLREALGLGKFSDFVIGAQAEIETVGIDEVEVYLGQSIAPAFFAWLVPTSTQKALVGLLSRHTPGLYLKRLMSSLSTQGKIVSAEAEVGYGGIPLKTSAKSYAERVIVVGTAAGQVKPTTGGGIYYGLLCAEIAADQLHQALKSDDLSAKSLAGYERRWKRKIGHELRIGYWARKVYEHLSDHQIDRIFDIIKSTDLDQALLADNNVSFDWHGRAVLRVLENHLLAKTIKAIKLPFPSAGKG
jgi:geranylgeranyl reductase family protein